MDLTYDRNSILNGNELRRQAEERPPTFAEYNGSVDAIPSTNLDRTANSRKAGQMGQRALELMTNPDAQRVTDAWMSSFSQSNPGVEFYRERMGLQAMQAQATGGSVV